ncbi:NAD-dependent epimerase/dehydratase family protein [Anaeromusa acidaminophila]|uniref:NAD-dependent epimerase/dehydratase family protein n=1 Tax=Anaeromusa acidaminophila TaxID=81464 RepID=UPI0003675BF7|nr:NAD(P)-dependent oxidoreductase [Anaeromusa acidaminophila]
MKVLVVGKQDVVIDSLLVRLRKEGNEVSWSPLESNLSYGGACNLEALLALHKPECLIYRPFGDGNLQGLEGENAVSLLGQLLLYAERQGVSRFFLLSSSRIFGVAGKRLWESSQVVCPEGDQAAVLSAMERLLLCWPKEKGLNTCVVRIPLVYGEAQSIEEKALFLRRLQAARKTTTVVGGDYLHAGDAADGIERLLRSAQDLHIVHLAAVEPVSIELVMKCLNATPWPEIEKEEIVGWPSLAVSEEVEALQTWRPRYSLKSDLSEWSIPGAEASRNRGAGSWRSWLAQKKPYLENATLFALLAAFSFANSFGGLIDLRLGVDYNFLYIALMGLLYGKKQALPAGALAAALFIFHLQLRGMDVLTGLYQMEYLVHLTLYLLVAIVTGYVTDNAKRLTEDQTLTMQNLQHRYEDLRNLYGESLRLKDSLAARIVNANDSLNQIYDVVRSLDSVRHEEVYTEAVEVVGRILQIPAVALYTVNAESTYLRLRVRSHACAQSIKNSLRITDMPHCKTLMEERQVCVNRQPAEGEPVFAAPISYHGRVVAVLHLYGATFEKMSYYHADLLRVVALMVSDVLGRAYEYDQLQQDQRYIEGTSMLQAEEFEKVKEEMQNRQERFLQDYALLVLSGETELEKLCKKVSALIRAEDYLGVGRDGSVQLLLPNTSAGMAAQVMDRLRDAGFVVEERVA